MAEGDTLIHAVIGGAVAIVTSALLGPASPVAGGAVAGYLQGGDTRDGATIGAIVGTIALVPFLLFAGLFVLFGFVPAIGVFTADPAGMMGGTGGMAPFGGGFFILFALLAFVVGALVVIGSGALGGVVGAYVASETDLGD